MANAKPELFSSHISVGTTVDWTTGEFRKFNQLAKLASETNDKALKDQIHELGGPPYSTHDQFQSLAALWTEYKGFGGTAHSLSEEDLAAAVMKSTEYSESEIEKSFEALKSSFDFLGASLDQYDAFEAVPIIEIPVIFAQGAFDLNAPTDLARKYYEAVQAPKGKTWVEFLGSAHLPMYEEPQQFLNVLKQASDL